MDGLAEAIQNVIEPSSWEVAGGEGRLQQLGSSLIVWQTRNLHHQIGDLLNQLRAGSGERKTVTIDARWLLLDSDELEQLLPASPGGDRRVERSLLAEFTRRPTSIRGITNCFSGQLVYLVSGTRRNVVTSYIPVVGSVQRHRNDERLVSLQDATIRFVSDDGVGNVGYQPIVSQLNFGALLEIRPTLVPAGDTAIVDLKSTLTVLSQESGNQSPPPAINQTAIETQELATTLRIPLGQPTLVGGLTYVAPPVTSFRRNHCGTKSGGAAAKTPTSIVSCT